MHWNKPSNRKVHFIYTGGTIGSTSGTNGALALAPALSGEYLLKKVSGLYELVDPNNIRVSNLLQLDSTDMLYTHRQEIADEIKKARAEGYDAVVVSHGTDQLANTSAYLTFNIPFKDFPVICTGAMVPATEPDSDAPDNLLGAFIAALDEKFDGDYVYFDKELLLGVRAFKTGREEAIASPEKRVFESPHYHVVARRRNRHLEYGDDEDAYIEHRARMSEWLARFEEQPYFTFRGDVVRNTALIELYEDFSADQINRFAAKSDGIVIKSWGKGGIPNTPEGAALSNKIYKWTEQGKVIIVSSRVPYFKTDLTQYKVGIRALMGGAIPAFDMNPDVALTKLRWALSISRTVHGKSDPDLVKRLMLYNLFDEIDPLALQDLKKKVTDADIKFDVDGLEITSKEVECVLKDAAKAQPKNNPNNVSVNA